MLTPIIYNNFFEMFQLSKHNLMLIALIVAVFLYSQSAGLAGLVEGYYP